MYERTALITVFTLLLFGCASLPLPGDKEPIQAAEACAPEARTKLAIDGHLYTTYSIAGITGYDMQRQLTLSYYSQYPDIDPDYDAVNTTVRYLFVPWYWPWHETINGTLHSLHAGNQSQIDQRRAAIKSALANSIQDPDLDWLSGLLIHAYGDAYAHTCGEYDSGREKAYGPWFGHGLQTFFGEDPDEIKNPTTEPKYLAYVDELYHTLRTRPDNDQSNEDLEWFKTNVREMSCEPGTCPIFHQLPNSDPAASESQVAAFAQCMNRTARRLKPSEVEYATGLVKAD